MTPAEIRTALSKLGGIANKRLGQHFLIDHVALETIVDSASIKPGDRVLEVGPGLGVLTRALIEKGADVTAIEQDRRFVEYLNSTPTPPLDSRGGARGGVRVVHGDAATIHWHELIGEGSWKFVSNLPYSITSLALRKALWGPKPPSVIIVLVQREVGERAIAKTGKTSLLSLMVALASSSARIVRRVPPGAFYPPPKVESVILEIVPMSWADREKTWGVNPEKIMELAKRGFAHPRKFLRSNLMLPTTDYRLLPSEKARAEDLSPDEWAKLAREIASSSNFSQ